MLIEINKKSNIYDEINSQLYDNIRNNFSIIYNFIPVKICENYYILTSSVDLEGYLMDYRSHIKIKLFINDNIGKEIYLNNIISFTENNYDINKLHEYDCFIDSICSLILIKYKSDELEYIDIDDNINDNINDFKNNIYSNEKILLNYYWTNNDFKQNLFSNETEINFIWDQKYCNLPSIPYIIDLMKNNNYTDLPIVGSSVYKNDKFIGIVSYSSFDEIVITPLISIKKLCGYMKNNIIYCLGIDTMKISLNLNYSNKEYENGLIIYNNFYDKLLRKKKTNNKNINLNNNNCTFSNNEMYFRQKNIICSIDNYLINQDGNIILNNTENITIPFKSYLWLFKTNNDVLKLEYIPYHNYDINMTYSNDFLSLDNMTINRKKIKKKNLTIKKEEVILNENYYYNNISSITINELKYIKWKNIKILELNEKILYGLKQFVITNINLYSTVFEKILNNICNFYGKKILLILYQNSENINEIKLINKINKFDELINNYKSHDELKKFIKSQIK